MAELHCGDRIPRCDECGAIQHGGGSCFHHAWCSLSEVSQELASMRAEKEKLRALLTPCRPDTDAQTDPAYPETVNDVLHLLSCYWGDFLPDDVELSDEYYAAWERQARPVIERLTDR